MYCVKCGVKLADTERKCPLCDTVVYHPDMERTAARQLYPSKQLPKVASGKKALSGMMILLFLIPLTICFFSDLQTDGQLDWFGYVAGALGVGYIAFALPLWFQRPNPVIFAPCNFAAAALYLLYIDLATNGGWFLCFALPITVGFGLIACTVVTLLYYIGRGKLYIYGGATIALGALLLLMEFLLVRTFHIAFVGWSVYPLITLGLIGSGLIYLAINSSAREMMERKLFF